MLTPEQYACLTDLRDQIDAQIAAASELVRTLQAQRDSRQTDLATVTERTDRLIFAQAVTPEIGDLFASQIAEAQSVQQSVTQEIAALEQRIADAQATRALLNNRRGLFNAHGVKSEMTTYQQVQGS
jgi:flagellar biosynthesis/type III secretory pathway chaperone